MLSIYGVAKGQGDESGYLAYWHETRSGDLYVYGRVVREAADLGAAVVELELEQGVSAAAGAAHQPALADMIVAIDDSDPPVVSRWRPATRDGVRVIIGLEPTGRPDPMYDAGCDGTVCLAHDDNPERDSGASRPAPAPVPRPELPPGDERAPSKRPPRSPRGDQDEELPSIMYSCGCGGSGGSSGCTSNLECSDGNVCTTDRCSGDPRQCRHFADRDGMICNDDGNVCTEHRCVGPTCTMQYVDADCDFIPSDCLDKRCINGACVETYEPDGTGCDDFDFCTEYDACHGGACSGVDKDCDDHDPCTLDSCGILPGDPPIFGACINDPIHCDDGNPCTDDYCVGGGCQNVVNHSNCDDGLFCNGQERCDPVEGCVSGSAPCPGQQCDEADDFCYGCISGQPCDDGDPCTLNDFCSNGVCVGTGEPNCDDGVACTVDECKFGGCTNTPDDSLCDDGDPCTRDYCSTGIDIDGDGQPDPGCTSVPYYPDPDSSETCSAVFGCSVSGSLPPLLIANDDDDNGDGIADFENNDGQVVLSPSIDNELAPVTLSVSSCDISSLWGGHVYGSGYDILGIGFDNDEGFFLFGSSEFPEFMVEGEHYYYPKVCFGPLRVKLAATNPEHPFSDPITCRENIGGSQVLEVLSAAWTLPDSTSPAYGTCPNFGGKHASLADLADTDAFALSATVAPAMPGVDVYFRIWSLTTLDGQPPSSHLDFQATTDATGTATIDLSNTTLSVGSYRAAASVIPEAIHDQTDQNRADQLSYNSWAWYGQFGDPAGSINGYAVPAVWTPILDVFSDQMILTATPERTGEATDIIYLLPGDRESFDVADYSVDEPAYLAIANTEIASLVVDGAPIQADGVEVTSWPMTVQIEGYAVGETELEIRWHSATGPAVCSMPIRVGGSISFEFDQLPTYRPYGGGTTTAGVPYITADFQLDNVHITGFGDAIVPESTEVLLDAVPNAVMFYRITLRDADGNPMQNKAVLVVHRPDSGFPTPNVMTVDPSVPTPTDQNGQVIGTIGVGDPVNNPDGYLTAENPEWQILILTGKLAADQQAGLLNDGQLQALTLNSEMPLDNRVTTGFTTHLVRDLPDGGTAEAVASARLPHFSIRSYSILYDFANGLLGRTSVSLTTETTHSPDYDIFDFHTPSASPIIITSDLWDPPGIREIELLQYPTPAAFAIPDYPNDDISRLLQALPGCKYDPEMYPESWAIHTEDGDPPWVLKAAKLAGTVAKEIVLGVIPGGDARDVVTEIWNFATGSDDTSYLVFSLAVIGLSADLGELVWAPLGAPANVVVATFKGLFKAVPPPVRRALERIAGGGLRAGAKLASYVGHYLSGIADFTNIPHMYEEIKKLLTQMFVMIDSPLVRHGGLADADIADHVADTVSVLADRGRALTDQAAEGIAAYARHGDEGIDAIEEMIGKFPANVADDSAESVTEAISKTYRDELVDGTDAFGLQRVDEAVAAARADRVGNLDELYLNQHIPGPAFKSHEEFEAALRIRGANLRPDQVAEINAIREAIGVPTEGSRVAKVLDVDTARSMVQGGNPNFSGYFTGRQYVEDLVDAPGATTQQFVDRLRLDRPGTPFVENAPRVVLETKMTQEMVGNARIPRSTGYADGNPLEYVEELGYPNSGNGFALSKDGFTVPETTMAPTAMSGGSELGVPDTIIRFQHVDGVPYPQTINGQTASGWRLVPHPTIPDSFKWEPYP